MFSADTYVKAFIDNNWLSIAILLYVLRSIATNFKLQLIEKIYAVLASAYQFVRPGTIKTIEERSPK